MRLSIRYLKNCKDRPWLLKREGGKYEQHAHLRTKKDALTVRRLIDANRYPYCKDYKIAMQRILTRDEYKSLNKKPRYKNRSTGGIR